MRLPRCPKCSECMVFTMCFPYKEYACLPCNTTEEFCCEKEEFSKKEHDKKKKKWGKEIHAIAIKNGAECGVEGDCDLCDNQDNYKFKFWRSNE